MVNIKNLKPSKNSPFIQGYFDRFNPVKYIGSRPIIYRSSYELKFMRTVEFNENVIKWSSEQIVIPYMMQETVSGKKQLVRHNYVVDFTVFTKDGSRYIIEVKPLALSPVNEKQIIRNPVMYKNACKWKAALAWAKQNNYQFKVITENHLKTKIF